jgi:hypothetical protein
MKTIYTVGCVMAATILGIGVADYWFANHQFSAFFSWAVLAAIPWLIGRASLYILSRVGSKDSLPTNYRARPDTDHPTAASPAWGDWV